MRVKIWTESGSLYVLDRTNMTWERLEHAPDSTHVRTQDGKLYAWPDIAMNKPLIMLGPGLDFGTRYIRTTNVTKIEEEL